MLISATWQVVFPYLSMREIPKRTEKLARLDRRNQANVLHLLIISSHNNFKRYFLRRKMRFTDSLFKVLQVKNKARVRIQVVCVQNPHNAILALSFYIFFFPPLFSLPWIFYRFPLSIQTMCFHSDVHLHESINNCSLWNTLSRKVS